MMKKWWPIIFIFTVWFIFSAPFLLFGKIPFPSDYLVNFFSPWSAYFFESVGVVKNNAMPDLVSQIYPWKTLVIESWKNGLPPLWNPYGFSGTPLLANYQSAVFSPINFLYLFLSFNIAWSIQILLQPLLAGLFTFIYVRSLKRSQIASLISSIAFMFCGFITAWLSYGTLGYAILFLPLSLFAAEKFYEKQKWYYFLVLTATIPLSFFSGHFQTSFYFLIFVVAYILFKYFSVKELRSTVYSLLSVCFGLLLSMPQLIPSVELYLNAARSILFLKREVIPWEYLPTFLAPDFFGNPVTRNDWFGHYAEWNGFVGLLPLMLGVYASLKRNRYVVFFLIASLISVCFAFNTPLLDLLVALRVPVLSTSALSRIIVIFSFSVSVLAAFGFDNLLSDLKERRFKKIYLWLFGFGIIFVTVWVILIFKLFIPLDKIAISFSNFRLSTIFFGIVFLSIIVSLFLKSKKVLIILSIIILGITTFDMMRFTTKWQPFSSEKYMFPDVGVTKFMKKKSGFQREFGAAGQEFTTITRVPGVEGYDPLYIGRYGEFIEAAVDGQLHPAVRSFALLAKGGTYTPKIIDFLGVKYMTHKISDKKNIWAYPYWKSPDKYKTIFEDKNFRVLENKNVFPRAFLVNNYKILKDQKEILNEMFVNKVDLLSTAIVEEKLSVNSPMSSGSATILSYKPEKIQIKTNTNGSSFLVLTDAFYPGWKAYVDDGEAKIYRTDFAFRGIVVPKGNHMIKFIYDPDSYKIGIVLGVLGLIGSVILALTLKNKRKK